MSKIGTSLKRSVLRNRKLFQKFQESLTKSSERERVGGYGSVLKQVIRKSSISCYGGDVFYFDGAIYKRIPLSELDSCILNVLEELGVSDADLVNSRSKILKTAHDGFSGKLFTPDSRRMCFNNCVLDLDSFSTFNFSSKYKVIYRIDYDFSLDNKSVDLWMKFLDRSLPDKQVQNVLQEAMGSILVRKNTHKQEKIFCLRGFGQHGKSVIQETLRGILGGNNNYFSAIAMKDLISESTGHFNVDRIVGKLVNFCSDMSAKMFDSETAKIIISRETVLASRKNKTPYETDDLPVQFCCLNKLPETRDFAEGRRVMVIPFYTSIPGNEVDPSLCNKLRKEYPGILNWMISGAKRYIKNGYKFSSCPAIDNVFMEYKKITSPPVNFMLSAGWTPNPESYIKDPDKKITPLALYNEYVYFCNRTNIEDVGERRFYKEILKAGYRKSGQDYVLYSR